MASNQPFDVAIIGGGIAGLSTALRLPEYMRVALFTKGQLGESNTRYAQGGLTVALVVLSFLDVLVNVAVGRQQIEPAVQVVVEEENAEGERLAAGRADTLLDGLIGGANGLNLVAAKIVRRRLHIGASVLQRLDRFGDAGMQYPFSSLTRQREHAGAQNHSDQ